jgi:hypothetical protein
MSRLLFTFLVLVLLSQTALCQYSSRRWKKERLEFHMGLGGANFLGELGGKDGIGTNDFQDLEIGQSRFSISTGLRYRLKPRLYVNTIFTYGKLSGRDNLTKEFFRNYRNLNFKTDIYELSINGEYAIIREQLGHRYRLMGVRGRRGYDYSLYFFGGIGVFHFDPKGKYNGEWHRLKPLSTEGQGFYKDRKEYSLTQICIPVGFGMKYAFNRKLSIGYRYGIRKTFTDYIDDVSTTYIEPQLLLDNKGELSVIMADRSNGDFPYITKQGEQRGDPTDKDSYMFFEFSIGYKLITKDWRIPLF